MDAAAHVQKEMVGKGQTEANCYVLRSEEDALRQLIPESVEAPQAQAPTKGRSQRSAAQGCALLFCGIMRKFTKAFTVFFFLVGFGYFCF